MALTYPTLSLPDPWRGGRALLVSASAALRLCSEGQHEIVGQPTASFYLSGLKRRDQATLRSFVAQARLGSAPVFRVGDADVIAAIVKAVAQGVLVIVRDARGAGDGDGTAEHRRLVRKIEQNARRGLAYQGRQYRLVGDVDLARLPSRDSYTVVPLAEASLILASLAAQPGAAGTEQGKLLEQARARLSRDWRPPLLPEGLVLLRKLIVQQAHQPDLGPAITPSQMRALVAKDWIEIEVVEEDGTPHAGGRYRIELTDGSKAEGTLDAEGLYAKYEIEPGECKLQLIDDLRGARTSGVAPAPEPAGGDTVTPEVACEPECPILASPAEPPPEEKPVKLRIKLLDLMGKPVTGAAVTVAGVAVSSDGAGLVEASATTGSVVANLSGREVALSVGSLLADDTGTEACKTRLFNLGFLWDTNVSETDDEMTIALQDFQAHSNIAVTGKLDGPTQAKLREVYGC